MSVLGLIFLFIIKPIQKHLWPAWTFYWLNSGQCLYAIKFQYSWKNTMGYSSDFKHCFSDRLRSACSKESFSNGEGKIKGSGWAPACHQVTWNRLWLVRANASENKYVTSRTGVYLLSNTTIWWIDIYIIYYIDNNYMFQLFSLPIFRSINEKLSKQLYSTCLQWGGKRWSGYPIHLLPPHCKQYMQVRYSCLPIFSFINLKMANEKCWNM